jgi:S1-C subfamily serine protease
MRIGTANENKYESKIKSKLMSLARIILPLLFILLSFSSSTIFGQSNVFSLTTGNNSASTQQQLPLTMDGTLLNNIFNKTQDSVVQITRTVPQTGVITIDPSQENRTSLGSGFLFDREGHIVTNSHVVGDAKIVDVTFTNGDRSRANVTAVDPYIDMAVLSIIESENDTMQQQAKELKPIPTGN